MSLHGFQFLDVHQQAAVAVEQHHCVVRSCNRHPHGEGGAVADSAKLADAEESAHLAAMAFARKNAEQCPDEFTNSHSAGRECSNAL